ncbi:DoxX family protein [Segetibacter aerophilus]|uniref:DoxX family protein n=1 Tax=Segetibacter aerophilus TaxID=670293 RepID=A0A512BGV4_9BACT|nr:DoxX family protein [Segetibacter aerophilus]GEO11193.1 hypothetical protein SAE01_36890 [Segetibacter aerophilus]
MSILVALDRLHLQAKQNEWLRYFAIFNRIALAIGFFAGGMVKIVGERFASGLSVKHPMGSYLEALHHTGYYYTFIGVLQVAAAILLLIPRTVLLGALIYFPIILNIFVLSFAVRFDGSLFTSPLMVISNLFLLCWHYDRLKYVLPFKHPAIDAAAAKPERISNKFPVLFFAGVVATVIFFLFIAANLYDIKPYNSFVDCKKQFIGTNRTTAGDAFCDCIHNNGQQLDSCLDKYNKAPNDKPLR